MLFKSTTGDLSNKKRLLFMQSEQKSLSKIKENCIFLHSSVGSASVQKCTRNYYLARGTKNMLFKSATGDLSNKKDCFCAVLTKIFGKSQRKLYIPP